MKTGTKVVLGVAGGLAALSAIPLVLGLVAVRKMKQSYDSSTVSGVGAPFRLL